MNPPRRKKLAVFSLLLTALPALPAPARAAETSMLDTVVVTADRIQSSLKEVSANMTVLTPERIQSSTATNVADLLSGEGFQVINQGPQSVLYIRGMGQQVFGNEMQSRVLVLINGRRIGLSNVGLMDINKDAIDRIEIIRGPSAVQYGSSALGGVVNIITKNGKDGGQAGVQGVAEVGFGSFNLNKQTLAVRGAGGGFDAALSLSQEGRNSYDVSGGDSWAHTGLGSSVASNFDLGYTFLQNHRLGLNVNFYNQNHVEAPDGGFSDTGPHSATYNLYDQRNWNLALQYEGADAGKLFTWLARYAFGRDQSDFDPTQSQWGGNLSATYVDNQSFTAQTTYNGDALSVNVGVDYLKYSLATDGRDTGESQASAGFFTARYRLFDEKLILSAGGRFDHYKVESAGGGDSTSDDNFAPSLGLVIAPKNWLKFRANYAEGFRMPTPNEYLGDAIWYIGNTDLRPEKSKTYEAGVDVALGIFTSSLTYFHTGADDKIIAQQATADFKYQFINLRASTIAGFEWAASLAWRPEAVKGLTIRPRISLTWLTTRENGDAAQAAEVGNDTIPNTPEYSLSYGVDFAYDPWSFKAGVNAVTTSDIVTRDWRTTSPTYWRYIEAGSGTVVNISLDKQLYAFADQHGKISLRLEANNIFDGKNEPYLDYPGPGRNFYAGLRYEF